MARLRVLGGPLEGRTFEISSELTLGREGTDVKIEDLEVSRRHAIVRELAGAVEVEDLGSSNGTFVDDERINGPTRAGDGTRIRLGTTVFQVEGVFAAEKTRLAEIADPDATRVGATVEPEATRPRGVREASSDDRSVGPDALSPAPLESVSPPQLAEPEVSAEPVAPAALAPEPRVPSQPAAPPAAGIGPFSPPSRRRRSAVATRSWVPTVLSFASVVLTAIALVIYFAAR
jgi:hypothetical protein